MVGLTGSGREEGKTGAPREGHIKDLWKAFNSMGNRDSVRTVQDRVQTGAP